MNALSLVLQPNSHSIKERTCSCQLHQRSPFLDSTAHHAWTLLCCFEKAGVVDSCRAQRHGRTQSRTLLTPSGPPLCRGIFGNYEAASQLSPISRRARRPADAPLSQIRGPALTASVVRHSVTTGWCPGSLSLYSPPLELHAADGREVLLPAQLLRLCRQFTKEPPARRSRAPGVPPASRLLRLPYSGTVSAPSGASVTYAVLAQFGLCLIAYSSIVLCSADGPQDMMIRAWDLRRS